MACRTPVVSTRTGWPEEAVKSGWNGVLVDVDDVSGIVQGVEWVLSRTDEEWRNLSTNAYTTASVGSWEESAKMLEKALEHACRRTAQGELVKAQRRKIATQHLVTPLDRDSGYQELRDAPTKD